MFDRIIPAFAIIGERKQILIHTIISVGTDPDKKNPDPDPQHCFRVLLLSPS